MGGCCVSTVAWLVLSAAGQLASAHRVGLNTLWRPPDKMPEEPTATALDAAGPATADAGLATADDVDGNRTLMRCLGVRTITRACHFENIYYDFRKERFVYFGSEGSTSRVFGEPAKPNQPWLKLIRCDIR